MSPMGSYNDSLLCQSIPPEKNELYDDFIRHVLQAYQAYKQLVTPDAPDVQAGNIKSSPHLHRPSRLVVSVSEDPNVTSPFGADSAKLTGMLSSIPTVHHRGAKRNRRPQEEMSMVMMNDLYEPGYGASLPLPMQMSSLSGMSMLPLPQSVQVQQVPMQVLSMPMQVQPMQVLGEPVGEVTENEMIHGEPKEKEEMPLRTKEEHEAEMPSKRVNVDLYV